MMTIFITPCQILSPESELANQLPLYLTCHIIFNLIKCSVSLNESKMHLALYNIFVSKFIIL
jgi:hypothetical protein